MKSQSLITAALLCSAVFASADVEVTMAELRHIGYLPQDKADLRPEDKINIKQRNPFAERKKVVAARPTEQVETEESKIRTFFDKLQVSGLLRMGDKRVVTLGRLTLEAGQTVPHVIPGQTQILRVIRVEDNLLEIGWVETAGYDTSVPRKILKKIDLSPKVSQLLASEDNTGENAQMFLTDDKGKVLLPPKDGLLPDPSALVDNLPPGSDTNPATALTAEEQAQMNAIDNVSPPPPAPVPATPDSVPDEVPASNPGDAAAPPESTEDAVQPDPDMTPVPAPTPAGPPAK